MSKYSHLDGLRGVASFIVVIFHFFILGFYPNSTNNLYSFCQNNLPYPLDELFFYNLFNFVDGKLAVFIFWVMSAYVIYIKLFRNNKNSSREYLISGASKRYLRLFLPCSASILFAYLLMKFGLIFNDDAVIHFKQNLDNNWMKNLYEFSPTFFSAVKSAFWDTFFNFKEVSCYNTVLWTMEKEFFGSLFCFLAFFIIPLNHYRSIFYFILLILFIYFNLIWMISFLVGYILCDMDHSNMNDNVLEKFKKMEKWLFSNHKFFTSLGLLLITIIIKPFLAQFASYYVVNITTAILVVYLVLKIEMCYNFFNIR